MAGPPASSVVTPEHSVAPAAQCALAARCTLQQLTWSTKHTQAHGKKPIKSKQGRKPQGLVWACLHNTSKRSRRCQGSRAMCPRPYVSVVRRHCCLPFRGREWSRDGSRTLIFCTRVSMCPPPCFCRDADDAVFVLNQAAKVPISVTGHKLRIARAQGQMEKWKASAGCWYAAY